VQGLQYESALCTLYRSHGQLLRSSGIVRDEEAAGSNPVIPTLCQFKPFDEHVEGLSHRGNKAYVIEAKVQTDQIEDLMLRGKIRRKPPQPARR
jgi:hypothetical protein